MTTRPLETLTERVVELVAEGLSPEAVARRVLPTLNENVLKMLASHYITELAQEAVRVREYHARVAAAEMQSPPPTVAREQRDKNTGPTHSAVRAGVPHGTLSGYRRGCRCAECVEHWDDEQERERRRWAALHRKIQEGIDQYTEQLRATWTEELLSSTFGTPSGRVTWADATVADHEAHIAMDVTSIEGYMRDAALHRQAIDEITRGEATCLKDILSIPTS